ncbi:MULTISPECIES: NAD(P)H-dependent glycerol-3-phosphate dehydrogenase [unclassified Adlercreutzia]|uniref:NAD(P)H-dependent glycerol-3-phosphate dehydrogenase n=1 Tax=unclassified Adlercreutzia TaxID=2636013 RepID=UPI0013EA1703|nr:MULTISPECIES: NAD(P)H-dependent glycerol-3-phosphate dehydrogenase [unclassified Adlercreutzia]
MRVAVIGAGSWGTALAQLLASKGYEVALCCRRQEQAGEINTKHVNSLYLGNVSLLPNVVATTNLQAALQDAIAAVMVTPSRYLRNAAEKICPYISEQLPVVICSKGVEGDKGILATDMLGDVLGNPSRLAVLSGPTHAEEVVRGVPSGAVCASINETTAGFFRDLFATDAFRTYTTDDVIGVELCGAFKNVIAIAVGISYGLGYGDNTAAMIMTRGLAEMSRMVVACGGEALTCMGLAGAGDMVVTCTSNHSRNRKFGQYYLACGRSLSDFETDTHMVVEGAQACKTLQAFQTRHAVDLPLTDAVRNIIWNGAIPESEARILIDRPLKDEIYGL